MPRITVGTDPTLVSNRNSGRLTITFSNLSTGGQAIYLAKTDPKGLSVENAEYPLYPGEKCAFVRYFDGPDVKLPWSALASGAGALLMIGESSEGPS